LNAAKDVEIKGAVHITGDAYLKFDRLMKFSKGIGFEFNNFKPQPIFELIQKTAPEVRGIIKDEEMVKTFNMGWGFAVVVDETNEGTVTDSFEKSGVEAERIGKVTSSGKIVVLYKGKKLELR